MAKQQPQTAPETSVQDAPGEQPDAAPEPAKAPEAPEPAYEPRAFYQSGVVRLVTSAADEKAALSAGWTKGEFVDHLGTEL